ncbi:MAG: gamma-glutamyl-gamma-aminobutyrate hydrolase family protein [Cyanobacteria bacterium NC_groundwater_1444_Ag_S-0.65um_54_12]|nr:gamma-glutamyl-gamma-aminobutyrate hydrolase family protein [Cyanobacteria bacterium NC_groundwater_1444_Ag_S-0.65um_54_12]
MNIITERLWVGITWGSTIGPGAMEKLSYYVECISAVGAEPVVVLPLRAIGDAVSYLAKIDGKLGSLHAGDGADPKDFAGLLFSGGGDVDPCHYGESLLNMTVRIDADRDAFELPFLRTAVKAGVPVLGICRGMQVMNIAMGGSLYQDLPTQQPAALEHRQGSYHEIRLEPASRLATLAGCQTIEVNSWHHQAVKSPSGLAHGLRATAYASDGIIEGCEPEPGCFSGYLLGIQWHPERFRPEDHPEFSVFATAIFADFATACRKAAITRSSR